MIIIMYTNVLFVVLYLFQPINKKLHIVSLEVALIEIEWIMLAFTLNKK